MWLFEAVSCERELIMISTSNLTWQRTLFFFVFAAFGGEKANNEVENPPKSHLLVRKPNVEKKTNEYK